MIVNRQKQKGFHLPLVLGIIVIVVMLSTRLGFLLTSYYQDQDEHMKQDVAFLLARHALNTVESAILNSSQIPLISTELMTDDEAVVSVFNGVVWNDDLPDYQLGVATDSVSGLSLEWWQQPESWWKAHTPLLEAPAISAELSAKGRAYFAVEYLREYVFSSDISVNDESSGIITQIYRITAAGFTNDGKRVLLTTLVNSTYGY